MSVYLLLDTANVDPTFQKFENMKRELYGDLVAGDLIKCFGFGIQIKRLNPILTQSWRSIAAQMFRTS